MCTGVQVKEARRLLGWSADRLGAQCGTGGAIILIFERTEVLAPPSVRIDPENLGVDRRALIRSVLEAAGIEFTVGDAPGARLRTGGEGA